MQNAIELSGVTKKFAKQTAVDQLDLAVPEGSIYGFIGPNGSGKTTTLRMILRIFQPDHGQVTVLGTSSAKTADDRLGYLPEERGLYKRMRVKELLKYYARLKGHFDCHADIDRWLETLQATAWSNKRIDALSKGMAQKIQFISAVVARPQLVILDEPFSGLDPVNMESLRDAVADLRKNGTTVVFSTHDMDVAERMCDTIFMIFKGRKVLDGTLDQIQSAYPANKLKVRFSDPGFEPPEMPEIGHREQQGRNYILTMNDTSQSSQVMARLMTECQPRDIAIHHFELLKPSLHDIFVQIARPDPSEMDVPVGETN